MLEGLSQEYLESLRARFWSKVKVVDDEAGEDNCWEWTAGFRTNGYGSFCIRKNGKDVTVSPHRLIYALTYGEIPEGLLVRHKCDNRACVRPTHLLVGTYQDNSNDAIARGRTCVGDKNGSRIKPERLARGERNGKYTKPECTPRGERHYSRTHPEKVPRGDKNGSRTHPERVPRGEKQGSSKLTEVQVLEIRALKGQLSNRKIAARYKVSSVNVDCIMKRKSWTHI